MEQIGGIKMKINRPYEPLEMSVVKFENISILAVSFDHDGLWDIESWGD